jgi:signal transduction histidine kinase
LQRTVGAGAARDVGLQVYDGVEANPEALLFDAGVPAANEHPPLLQHLEMGGRTWTLRFAATTAFVSATERALPPAALLLGLAATAVLLSTVRRETQARRRAEQAARRTAFLAEASKLLSSSLDYRRTLPAIAQLAAEEIADEAIVFVGGEPAPPLWCVGHRDPAHASRLEAALRRRGVEPTEQAGIAGVLRTRTPELVARLAPKRKQVADGDPELLALAREARLRSRLTVPLLARGSAFGALVLATAAGHRRLGPEELAVAEDLARLVAAAVDNARLYRDAQEAVRERDEFLSIASHELKTPLTSLALQSESLRVAARRGDAEATARKAEVVRRNVKRLAALVASMLDLSRIRAGRLELELEDVDLADVAREVTARFEDEAQRAGCTLVLHAPEPVVGHWDRLRIDQVLTNLLSNAVKYGPGKPVEVRVGAVERRAVLTVRDHGIGIPADDQRRIFEQFTRAVSERHYGGFGLGLWIVRSIVASLGGDVRVESAPGEGSTFTIELDPRPSATLRAEGEAASATGREA